MTSYSYIYYALILQSQIKLPEVPLAPSSSNDKLVQIVWGPVQRPKDNIENAQYKPDSVKHADFYYLEVADIASYYVEGKDKIIIQRQRDGSDRDIAAFLMDTVLTIVLLKHNKFVFHASAITKDNKAIMFLGRSGIGKSSLALRLLNEGYQFLEDDRCLLEWDENAKVPVIKNHLPFLDIWQTDQYLLDKIDDTKVHDPIRLGIQKLRIKLSNYQAGQFFFISQFIILTSENISIDCKAEVLKGMIKFRVLQNYVHMSHLVKDVSDPHFYFQHMTKLLAHVPAIRITRSNKTTLEEFAEYISNEILKNKVSHVIKETSHE